MDTHKLQRILEILDGVEKHPDEIYVRHGRADCDVHGASHARRGSLPLRLDSACHIVLIP